MTSPSSRPSSETEAEIAAAADRWFTRSEEGLTPEETAAFASWRRADPRHEAASAKLEAIHALLGGIPFAADRLSDLRPAAAAPERRRFFRLAGAVAAGLAVAAAVWSLRPAAPRPAEIRYATTAGGYERVTLADGSIMELNAESAVRVAYAAHERRVMLTAGEAHFTVMRDPARPFVVGAGTYAVRAVGTAFNVRLAPAGVEVLVTQGRVRVAPQAEAPAVAASGDDKPLLGAGQRVVLAPGTAPAARDVETMAPDTIRQALAWQERRLLFSDTPLAEVVAQFNRRNRTQLVLADESLGVRAVGGSFAADNVEAFVRLLETSGDIVSERPHPGEIVLRRAR